MKRLLLLVSFSLLLNASENLSLHQALEILKTQNLEIESAKIDESIAKEDEKSVSGIEYGTLNFIQDFAHSNDAGNVFGFTLSSREASFGNFGFSEFDGTNPNILNVQPKDLNYPDDRSYFQSKLKYEVPLFTGFALSNYKDIMSSMRRIKGLEKEQVINAKSYELRKSYYDMALLDDSIYNLNTIIENINTLEDMTKSMIEVGYAKHIDLLEVKAKKGNVKRLLLQMNANKKLLYHYVSFLLNQKVTAIVTPSSEIEMPILSDEEILKNNLDMQKASIALEIRKDMLELSNAAYYPTLGAFGELSTADDSFLGDADDHKAYTVGARLTWNIFNGGVDSAKIEKSKLEHIKMKSQLELARKGIALKLAKIRTEIISADEEIDSLKKELEFAEAIYKNYEGRYKEKLSSMSDVIIKQSAQIEKVLQLQIAKNRRNAKIFQLEKLANGEK
ncbi:TolC family protein [Sulfurimonas aquatica]|uniref:TolC family protein n=1 Tax=Sulfurimonas aquatica TaxID=2672570 RepID=A0A975B0P5_9BACT|nr:TolC family protein [Sulfurimonas aquatica]QSZ42057.1 TolC family protein [Sulfurimonas aquatica]